MKLKTAERLIRIEKIVSMSIYAVFRVFLRRAQCQIVAEK